MFCSNCGSQLPEGSAFCANCGAQVEAAQASYQQPAPSAPVVAPPVERENPELESLGRTTMILGIVGLATAVSSGLPGWIVSSIALKKAAEYESKAGSLTGKAKLGRNLAKPGKIVGIIMTFLLIFLAVFYGIIYGILLSNALYW